MIIYMVEYLRRGKEVKYRDVKLTTKNTFPFLTSSYF